MRWLVAKCVFMIVPRRKQIPQDCACRTHVRRLFAVEFSIPFQAAYFYAMASCGVA